MQAVARQLQQQATALTESVRQNAEFLQNETQARKREGMVDSKAVQKPERFSGKDADWASWAYKFTTWVETQQEGSEQVLEWAAQQGSDLITQDKGGRGDARRWRPARTS